jgi:hypothetical protein
MAARTPLRFRSSKKGTIAAVPDIVYVPNILPPGSVESYDGITVPISASRALIPISSPENHPPWEGEDHLWDSVYLRTMATAYVGITSSRISCANAATNCGHCVTSRDGYCVLDFTPSKRNNAWDLFKDMVEISKDPVGTSDMLLEKLAEFRKEEK